MCVCRYALTLGIICYQGLNDSLVNGQTKHYHHHILFENYADISLKNRRDKKM